MTGEKKMPLSAMLPSVKEACYVAMPPQATLSQAVTAMVRQRKTAIAVIQGDGLAGLVTRTDVLTALGRTSGRFKEDLPLSEIMTEALEVAGPEKSFKSALARMAQSNIEHLPVIQKGRLLTVLHENELLKHQLDALNGDIAHLQGYIEGLHNARQD